MPRNTELEYLRAPRPPDAPLLPTETRDDPRWEPVREATRNYMRTVAAPYESGEMAGYAYHSNRSNRYLEQLARAREQNDGESINASRIKLIAARQYLLRRHEACVGAYTALREACRNAIRETPPDKHFKEWDREDLSKRFNKGAQRLARTQGNLERALDASMSQHLNTLQSWSSEQAEHPAQSAGHAELTKHRPPVPLPSRLGDYAPRKPSAEWEAFEDAVDHHRNVLAGHHATDGMSYAECAEVCNQHLRGLKDAQKANDPAAEASARTDLMNARGALLAHHDQCAESHADVVSAFARFESAHGGDLPQRTTFIKVMINSADKIDMPQARRLIETGIHAAQTISNPNEVVQRIVNTGLASREATMHGAQPAPTPPPQRAPNPYEAVQRLVDTGLAARGEAAFVQRPAGYADQQHAQFLEQTSRGQQESRGIVGFGQPSSLVDQLSFAQQNSRDAFVQRITREQLASHGRVASDQQLAFTPETSNGPQHRDLFRRSDSAPPAMLDRPRQRTPPLGGEPRNTQISTSLHVKVRKSGRKTPG